MNHDRIYRYGFPRHRSTGVRLPASTRLTRTYLRTPAAWRVLGKQFLAIGRRA